MFTVGQHKSISVEPVGIGRVVSHNVFVQGDADGAHANGRTTVTTAVLVANVKDEVSQTQDGEIIVGKLVWPVAISQWCMILCADAVDGCDMGFGAGEGL